MSTSCTLRMVVGLQGVSILVKNGPTVEALKSWQLPGTEPGFDAVEPELRKVFGSERLLEWDFESKTCALASPAATLVPRRLFIPDNLAQYFKLLLRSGEGRVYGFERIEEFDCYLVWAAEPGFLRLCEPYFSPENCGHIGGPLLRAFHGLASEEGFSIFANLCGHKVQIGAFERRNLVFFNVFDYAKPNDLLYYVLLAYKQFDLNPLEVPLTLSGTLIEDSEIFRLLVRYVRPMRFPPLPNSLQLPTEAKDLPAHFWFDLASV